ncbi:hypothetical protein HYU06_07350 [Candidatus Woesearchaeota archaeon]|nr:hypothetical protein [Candidatus Woesearchaeota archaeon]
MKAILKSILFFITILFTFSLVQSVSAAPTITIHAPSNLTETGVYSTNYSMLVTSNDTYNDCSLYETTGRARNYTATPNAWSVIRTDDDISNNTVKQFTINKANGTYSWYENCTTNDRSTFTATDIFVLDVNYVYPTVTFGTPANATSSSSAIITYNITVSGAESAYVCHLWDNRDGTTSERASQSAIVNNTQTNIPITYSDVKNLQSFWNCTNAINTAVFGVSATRFLNVDTTRPSITVVNYTNGTWLTRNQANFAYTVTDENAATCQFWLSNSTGFINTSGAATNATSYTNATTFTLANSVTDSVLYDLVLRCNDTAGNIGYANTTGAFFRLRVDLIQPTLPTLFYPSTKNITTTDSTPTVYYTTTVDTNFANYTVEIASDSAFSTIVARSSNTVRLTNTTTVSSIGFDVTRYLRVIAYDEAGNSNTSAVQTVITKSLCANLSASQWYFCTNLGNDFTLQDLLGNTSATTVAVWNSTHQFQTYVSGGSGGTVTVKGGGPYLIYVPIYSKCN